jgi:hypothetical protein
MARSSGALQEANTILEGCSMTLCAREGQGSASMRRKTTLSIDGADFSISRRPSASVDPRLAQPQRG